jgi:hypothetical protein
MWEGDAKFTFLVGSLSCFDGFTACKHWNILNTNTSDTV